MGPQYLLTEERKRKREREDQPQKTEDCPSKIAHEADYGHAGSLGALCSQSLVTLGINSATTYFPLRQENRGENTQVFET